MYQENPEQGDQHSAEDDRERLARIEVKLGIPKGFYLGGFKPEVQHLPPSKVRRCKAARREDINNSSLKTA